MWRSDAHAIGYESNSLVFDFGLAIVYFLIFIERLRALYQEIWKKNCAGEGANGKLRGYFNQMIVCLEYVLHAYT